MKKTVYILLVCAGLFAFGSYAKADDSLSMAKRATYDYAAGRGEITLETFLKRVLASGGSGGGSTDLDAVLVLDYSGTMTNSYKTSSTSESKTYKSYRPTVYTYTTWNALGTKPKYTFKGKAYSVTVYHISNAGTSGNYGNWACFDADDGHRYYILPTGSCIQATSTAAPTKTSFPTDVNGNTIAPADGNGAQMAGFINPVDSTISKRYHALYAGVNNFIDLVKTDATTYGRTHRIALVAFRNEKWPRFSVGDACQKNYTNPSSPYFLQEFYGNAFNENNDKDATGVLKHFTSVADDDDVTALKSILYYRMPNGNTAIDFGTRLAAIILDKYARSNSTKTVIVFTDGNPTRSTSDSFDGAGTDAVKIARDSIKKNGYPLYTVYCGDSGLGSSTNQYKLMNALSSNYPLADTYKDLVESEKNPSQIYFKDSYTKGLTTVFTEIAQEVIANLKDKYDAQTKLVDYIESTNFKLPNDIVNSDIKVYTKNCTGYNSATKVYSWSADSTEITSSVTVSIDAASTPQSVSVLGFNYSDNWCGMDGGTPHGKKVLVKIPFELKNKTAAGDLNTNTGNSGAYVPDDGGNYTKDTVYNIPHIPFCKLVIKRTGLEEGESAIYIITDKDGNFMDRVVLSGKDKLGTEVETIVWGIPGNKFTVEETGWNWAYNKGENPQTKTVTDFTNPVVFPFTGAHKAGTGPEDLHKHDEAVKVNDLKLP